MAVVRGEKWRSFERDINSAKGLTWEVSEPSTQVDYMDLTITIDKGRITTTLYEKPTNRHLYISPNSSHPPGTIAGVIHGMIRRILMLCSDRDDQLRRIRQFVIHLRARGHHIDTIVPIVRSAYAKHAAPKQDPPPEPQDTPPPPRIFVHLPFHPDNPPSSSVQRAWKRNVSRPPFARRLRSVKNKHGIPIGVDRMTVAYHRSHNLGNLLSYRDLSKRKGPSVSSLIDG